MERRTKSGRGGCNTRTPLTETFSSSARSGRSAKRVTPSNQSGRSFRTSGSLKSTSGATSESRPYIIAVTEGRGQARGEVGIAAMDPTRPRLILCQISDNQTYLHSLTKINVFEFSEVLVPNTFVEGGAKLCADIRENFPRVVLTSVQRRHFNETVGLELINRCHSPESETVMVLLQDKFYALSAASALIKHVEFTRNVVFAPRSVKVEYQGTEETMLIDINTANRLELVASASNAKSDAKNSLFGVLNHCHTRGGIRLLRATILQPPCSATKIQKRLDCVEELVRNPLLLFTLESAVTSFANVDQLTMCMRPRQQDDLRTAEYHLKYVLLLKTMLELIPSLMAALEEATSGYFCTVRENLQDARYKIILDRVLESIFENAKSAKGSVAAHLHCCFAIRPGINDLLDVTKKTYCEIIQEIWELVNALREKHNLLLRMSFSSQKGFHIQCSAQQLGAVPLPKEFILLQKRKSTYSFYTSELVALDHRSEQALHEIKLLTNVILVDLLNDIRQHVGCLFNLCEYVAELDLIVSFAHVSSGQGHVRPEFADRIHVEESRHPILDVIHDVCAVANDVYADEERNFTILTGPNQSGKSIFIGQVALLQIMAQIGCYVPAKKATLRMTDRLFSRIGFNDSVECNASTLLMEMQDVNYLRQNLTDNSLVVMDELCRGTSVEEGTSLAFAICEELLDSKAFVFVTTHYLFLTKLEDLYSNVVNYHFDSELVLEDGAPRLKFTHRKLRGVTTADRYGLKVAEMMAFPSDVLAKAKELSERLAKDLKPVPQVKGLSARHRLAQELQKELAEAGTSRSATILRFRARLSELGAPNEGEDRVVASMKSLSLMAPKLNAATARRARKVARKYRIMEMRKRYRERRKGTRGIHFSARGGASVREIIF